jgi:hypothetical protein
MKEVQKPPLGGLGVKETGVKIEVWEKGLGLEKRVGVRERIWGKNMNAIRFSAKKMLMLP